MVFSGDGDTGDKSLREMPNATTRRLILTFGRLHVPKGSIMSRKSMAAALIPLFMSVSAGPAFARPANSPPAAAGQSHQMSDVLSKLHAVAQWSIQLSDMASKKAKSDLVKDYAREVTTTNGQKDAKLKEIAQSHGIKLSPVDPKTEEGKSLTERIKGETALLKSLDGDAFDKEYMTLVTNTQQSVIHFLEAAKAETQDQNMKQYLDDMTNLVQGRLTKAQDVLQKIYGNSL